MYKMLNLRPESAVVITTFAISLVNHLVNDTGTVHQGGLQVLYRYLQEVYSSSSSGVWTYTKAELLDGSAILLQQGQTNAYQLQQPEGVG